MTVTIEADGTRKHWSDPVQGEELGTFGATVESQLQGSTTIDDDTVQLTASDLPCEYVWICAPTENHTAGVNTGNVLIGTDDSTNIVGGIALSIDRYEGIAYPVRNANLVYLTAFNSGDSVEYQVFCKPA